MVQSATLCVLAASLWFAVDSSAQYTAPYTLSQFKNVINQCKVQYPGSSPAACSGTSCRSLAESYFRLDYNKKYMTFAITDEEGATRSELSQEDDWSLTGGTVNKIIAQVKLFESSTVDEYTFLQVHTRDVSSPKPFIRIVLRAKSTKQEYDWQCNKLATWRQESYENYVWAVIRQSTNKPSSETKFCKVPLMPRPSGFTKVEVRSDGDGKVKVKVGTTTKVKLDVTKANGFEKNWNGKRAYFKAGLYIQDDGTAKTQFKALDIYPKS